MRRWVIKIVILLGLLYLILTLGVQCFGGCGKASKEAPELERARWVVQTTSRVYYTDNYEVRGSNTVLHGYWYFVTGQDRWLWQDGDLVLDRGYGPVTVKRRD